PGKHPSGSVPRGSCLIHNWQEERATHHLDAVLDQEPGSEGFIYRHGHHRLLTHQLFSWPTNSTTMKDTYRPPHRALLLGRGQRQAMLESMLYQKYRQACTPASPQGARSCLPSRYTVCSTTLLHCLHFQPHNYHTEQPCSFWLEQARKLLAVTSIHSGDSPFRRNAAFSTPITESLEPPLHSALPSSWLQPYKQ
ncbi:SPAG8 protein, partial [Trogon melanurus]|nr:SPAG8 protein [Trogon melanurus]